MTILTLFEDIVKRYPENVAVIYKNRHYTFREIDILSDVIARKIVSLGAKPGDTAGVLVSRCEYMVIAALASVKAGMVFMPMDNNHPKERLEYMLRDSDTRILITTKRMLCDSAISSNETRFQTFLLPDADRCMDIMQWNTKGITLPEVSPNDRFTIIYTSGTTGQPKGVLIPHSSPIPLFDFIRKEFHLSEKDILAEYVSYGFDACINDIFSCLTSGAALLIVPDEIKLSLPSLSSYLIQHEATMFDLPTAVMMQFLQDCPQGKLRCIISGGEKFIPQSIHYTSCDIYNLYGPSEAFVFCTYYKIQGNEEEIPIGKPVAGNRIDILLEDGTPAKTGEIGEIMITGPQVGLGYLNQPELTREKFTRNPFVESQESRMYHTGDLGYLREDGNIMIVGRRDSQVKIRGNRLELKEVEAVVRQFPCVFDATIDAKVLSNGAKVLVAYVVSNEVIDQEALRQFVSEKKPDYMVPSFVMQLDKIPLTVNGKADKKSLPIPMLNDTTEYVAPRNDMEKRLCGIFSQVIGIEGIGIDHNIMDMGGDSLSVMNILEICSDIHGLTAPMLISLGSARKISEALDNVTNTDSTIPLQDDYPISGIQVEFYDLCESVPGNMFLHVPEGICLHRDTDMGKLREAVISTINNHPGLKATFSRNSAHEPRMYRHDAQKPIVEAIVIDDEEINEIREQFMTPFSLSEGPLYHVLLVTTRDNKYLLMDFHHFVMDGVSMDIILRDITNAYHDKALKLEVWTAFDANYIANEQRNSDMYLSSKDWYESTFNHLTCYALPPSDQAENPDNSITSADNTGVITVPLGMTRKTLEARCTFLKTSPACITEAAYAKLMAQYTEQKEVVFMTTSNGRNTAEIRHTVGTFQFGLPIYCKTEGKSNTEILKQVTNIQLMGIAHNIYPYTNLQIFPQLSCGHYFSYLGNMGNLSDVCGHPATHIKMQDEEAYFSIQIQIYNSDADDGLNCYCVYKSNIYSEQFMRDYISQYVAILNDMTTA